MKAQHSHIGSVLKDSSLRAYARISTSDADVKDPQIERIQAQTLEGISKAKTRKNDMLYKGRYRASNDMTACSPSKDDACNSSNQGRGTSVRYTRISSDIYLPYKGRNEIQLFF